MISTDTCEPTTTDRRTGSGTLEHVAPRTVVRDEVAPDDCVETLEFSARGVELLAILNSLFDEAPPMNDR